MNDEFKLGDGLLDKLSDEELCLLISMISDSQLLNIVKKNQKAFKDFIKGFRLSMKSKMFDTLRNRIVEGYYICIRNHNINLTNITENHVDFVIKEVTENIAEATGNKSFLAEALLNQQIDRKLIELLLDKLKPEYIKLFFKLMDYELTDEESYFIDFQMESIIEEKKLVEEISKRLEVKYDSKLEDLKKEYGINIANKDKIIEAFEKRLNDINNELAEIGNNNKHLLEAAQMTEIQIKNLKLEAKKNQSKKQELELSLKEQALIIEKLNKQLQMKYDAYSLVAHEKWETENQELLTVRKSIANDCEKMKKIKITLGNNIKSLEIQKIQLNDKILMYENVINDFIENIDTIAIEEALRNSLLKINTSTQPQGLEHKHPDLYIKEHKIETNIQKCKHIHDFADSIGGNLENIGVKGIADQTANFIIGILASGMVPLICGYKAREIATSISYSYTGETPYIITLPNGYTNAKSLLEMYNLTDANVVLIEDAVGTMNENALLPLIRDRAQSKFSSKLLLLATENMDSVRYMPMNIFNQVALVRINQYGTDKRNKYQASDAKKVFKEFVSSHDSQSSHKEINKLLDGLKLGRPYKIQRSAILGYSEKISTGESALQGYLRAELVIMCKYYNLLPILEDNIEKFQLGETLMEIVKDDLYD